ALSERYEILLAEDRPSALQLLHEAKPKVVTLDLGLPPSPGDSREGFMALTDFLQADPLLKVVVITGQSDRENGREAIGLGAYDFFPKPIDVEELKIVIDRAIHVQELDRERRELVATDESHAYEGIIGGSPQMRNVFAAIEKVS